MRAGSSRCAASARSPAAVGAYSWDENGRGPFGRPSLTRRKLRALELKTQEGWRRGRYSGPRVHETKGEREREREFSEQADERSQHSASASGGEQALVLGLA